jgi:cellulose synthase operon protein C
MTRAKLLHHKACTMALMLACSGVSSIWACGGGFPIALTEQRNEALYGLYEGNFWYEAQRLLPAPKTVFAPNPELATMRDERGVLDDLSAARIAIETAGYSAAQSAAFSAARASANPQAAYAAAEILPAQHRLYIAGAIAFRTEDFPQALVYFDQIIAAKDSQQHNDRLLWAYFMRATTHLRLDSIAQAEADFAQLRSLAGAGSADELGLAITSLGDQARWHLRSRNYQRATQLYAEQAASERQLLEKEEKNEDNLWRLEHGASQGAHGLLAVARWLYKDQDSLKVALQNDLVRRLMIIYAYSRAGEVTARERDPSSHFYELEHDYEVIERSKDAAGSDAGFVASQLANAIQASLTDRSAITAAGKPSSHYLLDRLSAVLYRAGDFEAAQKYADLSDAPLAAWVRAKLALRKGDFNQAAHFYSAAASSFPIDDAWLQDYDSITYNVGCRINAESATMHLVRGDFNQAAELFWRADAEYWTDFAYVAERVLSIEELRSFVQVYAPNPAADPPKDAMDGRGKQAMLRMLFARRLMREQHYREAIAYFDESTNQQFARQFTEHLEQAAATRDEIRAGHFYSAALLARDEGIRLFAYELDPDHAIWGGSTTGADWSTDADGNETMSPQSAFKPTHAAPEERQRFIKTLASPMMFFHYRGRAALLAEQASRAMPERSQAFAALLCKATLWTNDLNHPLGQHFYLDYLRKGPFVPWAAEFGQYCEEPNFISAAELRHAQSTAWMKPPRKVVVIYSGMLLISIVLGLLIKWVWRRVLRRLGGMTN